MGGGSFIGNTMEPEVDIQMGDADYDHVIYSDEPLDMDGSGEAQDMDGGGDDVIKHENLNNSDD